MSRFLLGALVMGAVFALTSFAVSSSRPATPTGSVWRVSDYQLDRAFRIPLVVNPNQPMTTQVTGGGFIITQVRLTNQTGQNPNLTVTVNGAAETMGVVGWNAVGHVHDLDPPIIARPGNTVTFSADPNNGPQSVVIAGYSTLPGET